MLKAASRHSYFIQVKILNSLRIICRKIQFNQSSPFCEQRKALWREDSILLPLIDFLHLALRNEILIQLVRIAPGG